MAEREERDAEGSCSTEEMGNFYCKKTVCVLLTFWSACRRLFLRLALATQPSLRGRDVSPANNEGDLSI